MYLDNKYTTWYNSIIKNAQTRSITGYTENHHVIPRSLGGSDLPDNLVRLTAREHYICHILLTKMTQGQDKHKMGYALHMLSNAIQIGDGRYVPNSRLYEYAKKLYKLALEDFWTPERRKRHGDKIRKVVTGRRHKPESIEKMKNKEWTQKALDNRLQNCLKAAEARKGSKWSEEHHANRFNTYVEKNKHLFPQVLELYDSGLNIRQVSLKLNISWERAKYIIDNRERLQTP